MNIKIHPLADMIPLMLEEQFQELKSDIEENGLKTDIILYQDKILDGRHRYRACEELEIKPKFKEYEGESPASYVLSLNTKRRDLSPSQRAAIAVNFLPEIEKEAKKRMLAGKADPSPKVGQGEKGKSSKKAAEQVGAGKTYVSDAKKIKTQAPEKFKQILSGEKTISEVKKEMGVHVGHNSGDNEWYTPVKYIEAAREVMETIDVDPASSAQANEVIRAKKFYTEQTNGLTKSWKGNVWMNPPYAQGLIDKFTGTLVEKIKDGEVEQAIVLVNNATETKWFQEMAKICTAICLHKGRIKFIDPEGGATGAPLQGQIILYFGENTVEFIKLFSQFGPTSLWK